jgi:hypothetical protein
MVESALHETDAALRTLILMAAPSWNREICRVRIKMFRVLHGEVVSRSIREAANFISIAVLTCVAPSSAVDRRCPVYM